MHRGPWTIRLTLAMLLIAGCSAPASQDGGAEVEEPVPLPGAIHDERDVIVSTGGSTLGLLTCGDARQCVDYPFSLPRIAQLGATLSWSVPGNVPWLRVLRDGEEVGANLPQPGDMAKLNEVELNITLSAGDYVLRVDVINMAGDHWVLDAAFSEASPWAMPTTTPPTFGPHVIIGVSDTGINPYHQLFYRPNLTAHPCTYIRDMPCDLVELPLSVGLDDWHEAVEQDRALWESIEPGTWYWIPKTLFVAVACGTDPSNSEVTTPQVEDLCILDDFNAHGARVTSIITMQNPEAYIAFHAGLPVRPFREGAIPVDLLSVSIGNNAPMFIPSAIDPCEGGVLTAAGFVEDDAPPLYFQPAGNSGWPALLDCFHSGPNKVIVGGGYTDPYGVDAGSGHTPEITSYFCPPYAPENRVRDILPAGTGCGTSFATPTAAGAVSKVILGLRRTSGYDGGITTEGMIDPLLGVSATDVRGALNLKATYEPAPKHAAPPSQQRRPEPLNPAAPWLQWGWGFYDADQAEATIAHLLGTAPADKPSEIRTYMETQYAFRQTMYG